MRLGSWCVRLPPDRGKTFYVTLDLSTRDFTSAGDGAASSSAGAAHQQSPPKDFSEEPTRASRHGSDEGGDEPMEVTEKHGTGRLERAGQDESSEAGDEPYNEVQIMELHSENPIISYRGRVFSGRWHENIGTELLLTRRDPRNPLPVLCHLKDDVELLAASRARIMVKEQDVKPRNRKAAVGHGTGGAEEEEEEEWDETAVPPADPAAPQERKDQGNFLAKLIAIKKQKGELDEVTVFAKGRDRDRVAHQTSPEPGAGEGHFTTPHSREHNRPRDSPRGRRGAAQTRRQGGRRARGRRRGRGMQNQGFDFASLVGFGNATAGSTVSTATPETWDDLFADRSPAATATDNDESDDTENGEADQEPSRDSDVEEMDVDGD